MTYTNISKNKKRFFFLSILISFCYLSLFNIYYAMETQIIGMEANIIPNIYEEQLLRDINQGQEYREVNEELEYRDTANSFVRFFNVIKNVTESFFTKVSRVFINIFELFTRLPPEQQEPAHAQVLAAPVADLKERSIDGLTLTELFSANWNLEQVLPAPDSKADLIEIGVEGKTLNDILGPEWYKALNEQKKKQEFAFYRTISISDFNLEGFIEPDVLSDEVLEVLEILNAYNLSEDELIDEMLGNIVLGTPDGVDTEYDPYTILGMPDGVDAAYDPHASYGIPDRVLEASDPYTVNGIIDDSITELLRDNYACYGLSDGEVEYEYDPYRELLRDNNYDGYGLPDEVEYAYDPSTELMRENYDIYRELMKENNYINIIDYNDIIIYKNLPSFQKETELTELTGLAGLAGFSAFLDLPDAPEVSELNLTVFPRSPEVYLYLKNLDINKLPGNEVIDEGKWQLSKYSMHLRENNPNLNTEDIQALLIRESKVAFKGFDPFWELDKLLEKIKLEKKEIKVELEACKNLYETKLINYSIIKTISAKEDLDLLKRTLDLKEEVLELKINKKKGIIKLYNCLDHFCGNEFPEQQLSEEERFIVSKVKAILSETKLEVCEPKKMLELDASKMTETSETAWKPKKLLEVDSSETSADQRELELSKKKFKLLNKYINSIMSQGLVKESSFEFEKLNKILNKYLSEDYNITTLNEVETTFNYIENTVEKIQFNQLLMQHLDTVLKKILK